MKKTKLLLPAIGLLCVMAGVFAFKAQHRFIGRLACYTIANGVVNHKFLGKNYTITVDGFNLACTVPTMNMSYTLATVTFNNI